MASQSPNDAKVASALVAAAQAAKKCDPRDTGKALDLVKHLKELEIYLEHSSVTAVKPACDVAARIAEQLVRRVDTKPEELLPWISMLLDFVAKSLNVDVNSTKPVNEAPKLSATAMQRRLSLVDGHRLGEILVRMSYLRVADVEKALEKQRAKGYRLGDALVEMQLLSREELDAALRVQKQKRNRQLDPWMQSSQNESHDAPTRKPREA